MKLLFNFTRGVKRLEELGGIAGFLKNDDDKGEMTDGACKD